MTIDLRGRVSNRVAGVLNPPKLTEERRLELICEAVRYSKLARQLGAPASADAKAVREAIFFLWEAYGRSKHRTAAYRSVAATASNAGSLVYDHVVPFNLLHKQLLAVDILSPGSVRPLLEGGAAAALITQAEDRALTAMGLQSRMPEGWDGRDQLARYRAAKIEIVANSGIVPPADRSSVRSKSARAPRSDMALSITTPEDHPKLKASSSDVKVTAIAICRLLVEAGFHLRAAASRDGFVYDRSDGRKLRIDPKATALRIKIGLRPALEPPAELIHQGRQSDWIEVRFPHHDVALNYIGQLFGCAE
jgi:hypothetical protein